MLARRGAMLILLAASETLNNDAHPVTAAFTEVCCVLCVRCVMYQVCHVLCVVCHVCVRVSLRLLPSQAVPQSTQSERSPSILQIANTWRSLHLPSFAKAMRQAIQVSFQVVVCAMMCVIGV